MKCLHVINITLAMKNVTYSEFMQNIGLASLAPIGRL